MLELREVPAELNVVEWQALDNITILGLQWGDEGKGKLLDALGKGAQVFVRFNGGGNTGHTVVIQYPDRDEPVKFKFHYLPSGVAHKNTVSVIANGVLVDMVDLVRELDTGQAQLDEALGDDAHKIIEHMVISSRAHLVLPYHKLLDAAREAKKLETGSEIGTTKSGCGPCIEDKVNRSRGLRVMDLFDEESFRRRFWENYNLKRLELEHVLGVDWSDPRIQDYIVDGEIYLTALFRAFERVKAMVCDTRQFLIKRMRDGDKVMFEGAQALHLDVDHGTYPYVTSGNTGSAGLATGTGLGESVTGTKIGVVKAYTSRVGRGPFLTKDEGKKGDRLRKDGHEYGTTTGRPRDCGWLDLPMLKYSLEVNDFNKSMGDGIGLTKLDVLCVHEKIKVCIGYRIDGEIVYDMPDTSSALESAEPIYVELDGWADEIPSMDDFQAIREYDKLPENARKYIEFIEQALNMPIHVVSLGPERDQTIDRRVA